LASIGISSIKDIEAAYFEEYDATAKECHELGNSILSDIINEAISNTREIGFLGKTPIPWEGLTSPLTVLGDNSVFTPVNVFQDKKSGMDANHSIEYLEKMGRRCHEFYEACVAL
jgi:hypothetical protein